MSERQEDPPQKYFSFKVLDNNKYSFYYLCVRFFLFLNYFVHLNTVIWEENRIVSFAFDRYTRYRFIPIVSNINIEVAKIKRIERDRKYNLQIYINICTRGCAGWKVRRQFPLLQFLRARHTTGQSLAFDRFPIVVSCRSSLSDIRRGWTRHIDLKILLNTCDSSYHHHHRLSSLHYQLLTSVNHILSVIMLINSIIFIIVNAYLGMCIHVCVHVCMYACIVPPVYVCSGWSFH